MLSVRRSLYSIYGRNLRLLSGVKASNPSGSSRSAVDARATVVQAPTSIDDTIPQEKKYDKALRSTAVGVDVLHDPLWNKGTAFSELERDRLGLSGLLPPVVRTIDQQKERVLDHLKRLNSDEEKNMYLQDLCNRNETLYFSILVEHIEEMAPLVYTPTVGNVCLNFADQYRRARGLYLTRKNRGDMHALIHNWPYDDVHVIVVTDGSRILGLGDLGINGMGIPIGKLALYCAAGGIAPHRVLPVMLDVGTNNEELRKNPLYMGTPEHRLDGPEYFEMVDEFMQAVFSRWPNVTVQFEDFETPKAVPLLARYKDKYRMFNDDIQGTGSVTVSGMLSALRNANESITDCRVLCVGAGSAGLGVCDQIVLSMVEGGMTKEEAMGRFVVTTSTGALGKQDGTYGDPNVKRNKINSLTSEWVNEAVPDGMPINEIIKTFRPTVRPLLIVCLDCLYSPSLYPQII